jgi:alkaline phosphatase D
MIDGRQYRSREACYGPPDRGKAHALTDKDCAERLDPARSILGMEQEAWLFDGLAQSKSQWNLIANDVLMAQFRQKNDAGEISFWSDDWNGYPQSRKRLMQHIADSKVSNPVVVTGDIHSFWANDLKLDFDDPASPILGTEFVGTSITSYGPPHDQFVQQIAENGNTHVHFFDGRVHGYISLEMSREATLAHYRVVSDAKDPKAQISTLRSFVTPNGKPGIQNA